MQYKVMYIIDTFFCCCFEDLTLVTQEREHLQYIKPLDTTSSVFFSSSECYETTKLILMCSGNIEITSKNLKFMHLQRSKSDNNI